MDIKHEKHLEKIRNGVDMELGSKYRKGQAEHGGDIWRKGIATLIGPEIRAEAIDLIVYTDCLNDGLLRIREICNAAISTDKELGITNHGYLDILRVLDGEIVDNLKP